MASVPGYFFPDSNGDVQIDSLGVPEGLVEFPRACRYGSTPLSYEEGDIVHETDRGKKWVYKQFSKVRIRCRFRFPESELSDFEALHLLTSGQETPFYFVPDVDDPATYYYVRKEADFDPRELDSPGMDGASESPWYDYVLDMLQEPTDEELGA